MDNYKKIGREEIMVTPFFQSLNKMMQKFVLRSENIEKIRHGVNVVKNIGVDEFLKNHNPRYNNLIIIKQISQNGNIENE